MKINIVIILALLLISVPAVKSLFIHGGFTSHDLTHHVIRQISMDKLLSEGQFPPRWSGELNNGYGYPVFLFNYPLPAMVGEIFHKLGMGYVDSVKAVLFLSMIFSVLGMYLFLNALLKDRMSAFLGAIFYLYAPLRFLNVYVSAAVGSALALGILPFVFWAVVKVGDKGNRGNWGILGGGIFLALLILAHNVTALIFAPILLVFSGLLVRKIREIRVIREIGVMFLLGLGLSAWFWMPAIFEAQYTKFGEIFGRFYQDQFPSLWQLIRSPWGYGLSHPASPEPGDMSYQIGLIHIGVMMILAALVWARRGIREIREIGGVVLAIFAISVFLMLKVSLPLWENVPFLSMIQFPLRLQAWSVFSASIAAALLIKYLVVDVIPANARLAKRAGIQLKKSRSELDSRLRGNDKLRLFSFILLLVLVIYANRNHWNINEVFNPGENYYLNLKTTSTSYGEHLPKWGRQMDHVSFGKLEFIEGSGQISIIKNKSDEILGEVEVTNSEKLRLNQFYFPGWEIKVDDKKIDFSYLSDPDSIGADTESYGLPVFDIEKGKHMVEASFKNTPIRNLADGISLISVVVFLYAGYKARIDKK